MEVSAVNAEEDRKQSWVASLLLREGHGFPWTEAMARSRWKPWAWVVWLVLRVVLVVLAVVLIGWGIKALVDRREAMEAAEIIALTAVLVTGFGAVFTVAVNAWLANRRLAHERELQVERSLLERRLTHEPKAAKAYQAAEEVRRKIGWDQIEKAATLGRERLSPEHKAVIMAAVNATAEAEAYAWREGMGAAAARLSSALVELENKADASIGWLYRQLSDADPDTRERAREQFQEVWWDYDEAVQDFRREMNG